MAPKAAPKPGAKKGPPAGALAKIKMQLAAQREEEERLKREEEEEERRLREEERLAEEQRKFEIAEALRLEEERKAAERDARKAAKNDRSGDLRRLGEGYILPDVERIRAEEAKRKLEEANKPKVPKPAPKKVVEVVVEEEDDRDEWEIEAERMEMEEAAAAAAAEAEAAAAAEKASKPPETVLRSPICCVLGHVDTGKTSLLDRIRRTNVQGGEAGGITQQIGATFFPKESLVNATAEVNKLYNYTMDVPGLLVIDTPGHESFSNLRSRGSSLCDIAILVVDLMHGLEQQTRESIQLLRKQKCPFIIALNKVDRCYDWVKHEGMDIQQTLALQKAHTREEFYNRWNTIRTEIMVESVNSELYFKNDNLKGCVSVVPTSAHTGEGVCDLLLLMIELVQRFMGNKVSLKSDLQCTVLEVKPVEGFGPTIDTVLVNGELNEGDNIIIAGVNGPIKTQIRALLTPQPMRESRVKGDFVHHKSIQAAIGVKIVANDLAEVIPGTQLRVIQPGMNVEQVCKDVQSEVSSILSNVDKSGVGVSVQSSTLGSLEALLSFLKDMSIPVASISLGPIHKRHMHQVVAMRRKDPKYSVMLAFDVPITPDAEMMAKENDVTIFSAKIIYHLFDRFKEYYAEYDATEKKRLREVAVFPVMLTINSCIHANGPLILGVDVKRGNLYIGTPIGIMKNGRPFTVGKVMSIQKDGKDIGMGKRGESYAIMVANAGDASITYGRHFDDTFELVSILTRPAVDAVKNFASELDQDAINLLRDLVKLQNIPAAKPKPKEAPNVIAPGAEDKYNKK